MAKDPICGMHVDEKSYLRLSHGGKNYYFCSSACLKRFAARNHIADNAVSCAVCKGASWYRNKTLVTVFFIALFAGLSFFIPRMASFRMYLAMYIKKVWWAIALGFLLGGIIDHFVPREYISKILAGRRKRTIFYSVILGFLMSACSHGILALSIELHKKGASNPSVVAFLLASPWANITITIMLMSFFGLKALYIIFSAVFVAATTGLLYQLLDARNMIEKNTNTKALEESFSIIRDIKARAAAYRLSFSQLGADIKGIIAGAVSLADMVLWWILIGIGLSSLIATLVPQEIFRQYMGPTALGLAVTLGVAAIIEVCSEGSSPLAFEIYRQTGAFGNAFVFLAAGVATDYTEIGLIWQNVGRRTALWMPVITVPQIIILGVIANHIFG